MGLIAKIRAWWREATMCEKHGRHPPTQVCHMCMHEALTRAKNKAQADYDACKNKGR